MATPSMTPLPAPTTPTLHATMATLTPPHPVPAATHEREPHWDMARSLPRDYGASLRDLAGLSFSPHTADFRDFSFPRKNHLGGSWDQLDAPKMAVPQLRASWDCLGPTWDKQTEVPLDLPRGPDALLTHTLRPTRRQVNNNSPRKVTHECGEEPRSQGQLALDLASPRDSVAGAKGLLNAPGQNNCFLNSAVQVSV